jgi:hypothetical protein
MRNECQPQESSIKHTEFGDGNDSFTFEPFRLTDYKTSFAAPGKPTPAEYFPPFTTQPQAL